MAPSTAPASYTDPFDIQDYLQDEGLQLSLDDRNEASGQWIYATSAAAALATSVQCQPLPCAMQNGNTLNFGGAAMQSIVQVILDAPASKGDTQLTVSPLAGEVNLGAVAIDGGVNAYELARIQKAIAYASSKVNDYCMPRYQSAAALQSSWTVNRWATILAAKWLRSRGGRPLPQSVFDDAKEAMEEMKAVSVGQMQIGDLGTPIAEWPAWSNTCVDPSYWNRKLRVQRPMSEQSGGPPTGYAQQIDWWAEGIIEF